MNRFAYLAAASCVGYVGVLHSDTLKIEFVTEIRNVSIASFQVGEKSRQTITLDFSGKTSESGFSTGVTDIIVVDLPSLRDDFKLENVEFNETGASFSVVGTTGSFVAFFGDIDYQFTMEINKDEKELNLSGCHNEYPSYYVLVGGKKIYDREQSGAVLTGALMGECDIKVKLSDKSY